MNALSVRLNAFPLVLTGSIALTPEAGEGISFEDYICYFTVLLLEGPDVEIPKHLSSTS